MIKGASRAITCSRWLLPLFSLGLGIVVFAAMVLVLCLETLVLLARNDAASVDRLLGPRTFQDETDEALEAVGMRPTTARKARAPPRRLHMRPAAPRSPRF